jgi:hypothetical protein
MTARRHMSSMSVDTDTSLESAWLQAVRQAVRGLAYGSVEVVIHDGRVVQIERREKVRLEPPVRRPNHPGRSNDPDRDTDRRSGGADPTHNEETSG